MHKTQTFRFDLLPSTPVNLFLFPDTREEKHEEEQWQRTKRCQKSAYLKAAQCRLSIAKPPYIYIYIYIHTHTHTHIYIYIYI